MPMSQLFDPSKPLRQRNGRSAEILRTDGQTLIGGVSYPICANVEFHDGAMTELCYRADGRIGDIESPLDLINYAPRRTFFVPFTPGKPKDVWEDLTREEALAGLTDADLGLVEIIFEGDYMLEAKYHKWGA